MDILQIFPFERVHLILTARILHPKSHLTYWHYSPHCYAMQVSHPRCLLLIVHNNQFLRLYNSTSKTFLKSNMSSLFKVRRP